VSLRPGGAGLPLVSRRRRSRLPGFAPTLGFTLFYLGLLVLIPLAGIFVKTSTLTWPQFWSTVTSPRAIASYKLTFGASAGAATINALFGSRNASASLMKDSATLASLDKIAHVPNGNTDVRTPHELTPSESPGAGSLRTHR
jgi:sulfate/thiosulfate transport system permease protein